MDALPSWDRFDIDSHAAELLVLTLDYLRKAAEREEAPEDLSEQLGFMVDAFCRAYPTVNALDAILVRATSGEPRAVLGTAVAATWHQFALDLSHRFLLDIWYKSDWESYRRAWGAAEGAEAMRQFPLAGVSDNWPILRSIVRQLPHFQSAHFRAQLKRENALTQSISDQRAVTGQGNRLVHSERHTPSTA